MWTKIQFYVSLYMGGSKGKAGMQVKRIPEKRGTNEMHPEKVIHIIGG